MTPIHELLARMRWDSEFGRGRFELTYEDKLEGRLLRVPLDAIRMAAGQHFAFEVAGPDGKVRTVPLHRVREVWRNGRRIWSRAGDAGRCAA